MVIPAVGNVISFVIATPALAEQPLEPVTVTVSLPAVVAKIVAVFPKLLFQAYKIPPVAVKLIEVLMQFNSVAAVLLLIAAIGALFIVIGPETVLVLKGGAHTLVGVVTVQ